jgi:anti-sigma B factor antagonist
MGSANGHRGAVPPECFGCTLHPERERVRLALSGELDLDAAPEVGERLRELGDAGFDQLVLDLSALEFIDSSGLRAVLAAVSAAREQGRELTVVPGPLGVQRVFEITGTAEFVFGRTG